MKSDTLKWSILTLVEFDMYMQASMWLPVLLVAMLLCCCAAVHIISRWEG